MQGLLTQIGGGGGRSEGGGGGKGNPIPGGEAGLSAQEIKSFHSRTTLGVMGFIECFSQQLRVCCIYFIQSLSSDSHGPNIDQLVDCLKHVNYGGNLNHQLFQGSCVCVCVCVSVNELFVCVK